MSLKSESFQNTTVANTSLSNWFTTASSTYRVFLKFDSILPFIANVLVQAFINFTWITKITWFLGTQSLLLIYCLFLLIKLFSKT